MWRLAAALSEPEDVDEAEALAEEVEAELLEDPLEEAAAELDAAALADELEALESLVVVVERVVEEADPVELVPVVPGVELEKEAEVVEVEPASVTVNWEDCAKMPSFSSSVLTKFIW